MPQIPYHGEKLDVHKYLNASAVSKDKMGPAMEVGDQGVIRQRPPLRQWGPAEVLAVAAVASSPAEPRQEVRPPTAS
jgi:hypothetical protein